ncbi:hypothetical protein [Sandaracinus amylolyticus]|nr:hypothetical protein [Sandaracinus amylolyticus]
MSEGRDKPGGAGEGSATQSSEAPRWAADEPTAMWDEGSLRDRGFDDVAQAPSPTTGPATAPGVGGDDRATVHSVPSAAPRPVAPPPAGGLSWPMTVAIATIVAVVVYFAVRLLMR